MSMAGSMRVLGSSLLVVPGSMQLGEESMSCDFLDWFSERYTEEFGALMVLGWLSLIFVIPVEFIEPHIYC